MLQRQLWMRLCQPHSHSLNVYSDYSPTTSTSSPSSSADTASPASTTATGARATPGLCKPASTTCRTPTWRSCIQDIYQQYSPRGSSHDFLASFIAYLSSSSLYSNPDVFCLLFCSSCFVRKKERKKENCTFDY